MSSGAARHDCCDYCKLPLPRPWKRASDWNDHGAEAGPSYCCFGCRLAAAITQESGEAGAARTTLTRLGLAVFFTMNVTAFTMALWSGDVYGVELASRQAVLLHQLFQYVVLLFAFPVLFLLGWPLFENACHALRHGILSTDLLLATGIAAAFLYSTNSVIQGRGAVYFEVGCVVLVAVTLGRWLEATGRLRATDALDRLARLLPAQVRRIRGGPEELIPLQEVVTDDLLRVLPGERFPADGRLVRSRALVDEQVLTGESQPVVKQAGETVLGGTLNLDGDLLVEVTAAGPQGTLARLVELVRQARAVKGGYERLADRMAAYFFPATTLVALGTFLAHWWAGSFERGALAGLAVVLIACPCALGLATPLAVWTALARAAREQVLFRSGEALERLAAVRAIRFDKTGTLTTGRPRVARRVCENDADDASTLARAVALAASSTHALSQAILDLADRRQPPRPASEVRVRPGLGIAGQPDGAPALVFLGNRRLMDEQGLRLGPRLARVAAAQEARERSLVFVGWEGAVQGLFLIDEDVRPCVPATLAACRKAGYDLAMLTGDHAARGQVLGTQLGIRVEAGLLPEGKVAAVRAAHNEFGCVAMVGDGINDAPALAASDVGVGLGCGTDLSRDSAQVCLMSDDLSRLPWSIALAERTVRVVRQNLFWAFGYNGIGVVCAALGWLNPAVAALLMVGSSVLVIMNSLRLGNGPGAGPDGQAALPEPPVLSADARAEERAGLVPRGAPT